MGIICTQVLGQNSTYRYNTNFGALGTKSQGIKALCNDGYKFDLKWDSTGERFTRKAINYWFDF